MVSWDDDDNDMLETEILNFEFSDFFISLSFSLSLSYFDLGRIFEMFWIFLKIKGIHFRILLT